MPVILKEMTSAHELRKDSSLAKSELVGLRSLPQLKFHYYARTPKPNPFATVWLPVNASNRLIIDKTQDIMHLYYSRHYLSKQMAEQSNRQLSMNVDPGRPFSQMDSSGETVLPSHNRSLDQDSLKAAMWMTNSNSVAPFASLGKPTCGFYFSGSTDHKKRLIGIPATDLVKWRSQELHSH